MIKLLRFFCINICCLSTIVYFLYHSDTVIQVSSKLWMFLISAPYKTRTFTVRLAVTTNTKETVLQQMCCLDPRGVPIGPIVRGVIACPILGRWWDVTTQVVTQSSIGRRVMVFRIFSNNDRPPFWILKILIFHHVTIIVVRICCCIPNFIKIGSCVRHPNAHNCWMSSAQLLGNGRSHGNRIMADMSGTWWDATSQVSSQLVYC